MKQGMPKCSQQQIQQELQLSHQSSIVVMLLQTLVQASVMQQLTQWAMPMRAQERRQPQVVMLMTLMHNLEQQPWTPMQEQDSLQQMKLGSMAVLWVV
jgi:hypothetical protein